MRSGKTMWQVGGEIGGNRLRVNRGHSIPNKMIGWLENHFPVARREPQLEFSAIVVNRRGRGLDGPALAALAAGDGGAGDRRDFSVGDCGQRLVRNDEDHAAVLRS